MLSVAAKNATPPNAVEKTSTKHQNWPKVFSLKIILLHALAQVVNFFTLCERYGCPTYFG